MMAALTLEDWNWATLLANQALLGAISPNIHSVKLCYREGKWILHAVVHKTSSDDEFYIEEAADDLSIYLAGVRDRISEDAYADVGYYIELASDTLEGVEESKGRDLFLARTL